MTEPTQTLRQKLLGGDPRVITDPNIIGEAKEAITDVKNKLLGIDPDFDQSGVQDFWFRAGLSRMDTDDEREGYLTRIVGPTGWTKDKYGKYALTTQGLDKRGYEHKGKPIVIDEPDLSWSDIGDVAGDAPAVMGATGAGLATTGMGAAVGIPAVIGGAMLGKGLDELIESLTGQNRQSFGEVAKDVAIEGGTAGIGEGVFRGLLRPLGRKLMAPERSRVTDAPSKEPGLEGFAKRQIEGKPPRTPGDVLGLAKEAQDMGVRPNVSQITQAPLLGRTQSMINRIFGDPLAEQNSKALNAEIARIREIAGPATGDTEMGDAVVKSISMKRGALARWAKGVTEKIDQEIAAAYQSNTGEAVPVVPTAALKETARDLTKNLPASPEGRPVFTDNTTLSSIKDALALPEYVTVSEMQAISQRLFDAIGDNTIVPGITGRQARQLWKASRETFEQIADPNVAAMVKEFHKRYGQEIKKYDNALVERIMRDPRLAGKIEPEHLVDAVFTKHSAARLNRIKNAVSPGVWEKFQRAAMDNVLDNAVARSDRPLREIFTGKNLLAGLDKYGKDTLTVAFGPQLTGELYRLGNVMQLVTQRQALSGGLVAAHIAIHPLQNIGRLAQLNILSRFLNTPFAVRWLTEGLKAPNTRMGAESVARATTYMIALAEQGTTADAPNGGTQ